MDKSDSIKVVVRIRGPIQREVDQGWTESWVKEGDDSIMKVATNESWIFNKVYGMNQPTVEIFDDLINPIMEDVMKGINGTVFAYGQTSSGKTYTMMGKEDSPGIIQMCINSIFNRIENTPDRQYLVLASYMEIYNECVVDLLTGTGTGTKKQLSLGETLDGEVFVKELLEKSIKNGAECLECLKIGERARHYGQTNMNDISSRSHVIFRIIIESKLRDVEDDTSCIVSQLNLIDLAGSEKLKQTGSTGQRAQEGAHINKSLLTLSQVINQLTSNASHISYRDSKLTRILQNSLGGNSKTAFICAVTPAAGDETQSTLRFAMNVKKIKNKPIINELVPDSAQLLRVIKEKDVLVKELNEMKKQKEECDMKVHDYNIKITQLQNKIIVSSQSRAGSKDLSKRRRETWCAGKMKSAINFQPNIREECEDESMDDGVFPSSRRSCGLFSAPIKESPVADFSDDVDLMQQQRDFERDVFEQQIRRLTETIETLKAEKYRDVLSVARDRMAEELEKKMNLFYLRDEEMVHSMASPIKMMHDNDDKTMQTSILECDDALPKEDLDTMEMMVQTSFVSEEDKVRPLWDDAIRSIEQIVQTSFHEHDNDDAHANLRRETEDKMIETSFLETIDVEKHEVMTQTSFLASDRETSICESANQIVEKSSLVEEKPFSLADELAQADNKMYEEKLNDYEDRIDAYETQINDYGVEKACYESRICDFESKISDYEGKMNEFEERFKNYENQISDYTNQIVILKTKHEESVDQATINAERMKRLDDELESTKAMISSLSSDIQSKDLELDQYRAQIKETEGSMDNISELLSNSKSQMDNLATEIQALNLQNKELRNDNSICREEFQKQIDGINKELTEALLAKDEFKLKLDSQDGETETILALKNQIELILDNHKKDVDGTNKMHFEVVDVMEKEKALAEEQFKQRLVKLEDELAQEKSRQDELGQEKEYHESEIEALKKQNQLLKESQVVEKSDEEAEMWKEKYEEGVNKLSEQIENLKEQHRLEIEKQKDLQLNLEKQYEYNEQISAYNSEILEMKKKLEKADDDLVSKIQELQDEHAKEIEYINKQYSEAFEEMKKDDGEVKPEEIQKLTNCLDEARSKLEESQSRSLSFEAELKEKIAKLAEASEKFMECEATLEKCKLDHDNEIVTMTKERTVLQGEVDELKRNDEALREEYMRVLKTIDEMHKEELQNIKNDHTIFVEDLKSEHMEEMEQKLLVAREKFDSELNDLSRRHEREIESAQEANETKLAKIKNEHEAVLRELNLHNVSEMEQKLLMEKETFDLELNNLKKCHIKEMEDKERQNNEDLRLLKNEHETKMEQFKRDYMKQCMDQLQNNEVGVQKRIDELTEKADEYNKLYLTTLHNATEMEQKLLMEKETFDLELNKLKKCHIKEIEDIERKHIEDLCLLKNEHETTMEQFKMDYTKQLQNNEVGAQKTIDELTKKVDEDNKLYLQTLEDIKEKSSEINELKSELDRITTSRIVDCEHLNQKHKEDLESIKQLHSKALEDVTNDRDRLLQKVQNLQTDAVKKEEEVRSRHEEEMNSLKNHHSTEIEKIQNDHLLASENLKSMYSEQIDTLNSKNENLDHLQGYTRNQFLQLLHSFQIDIVSSMAGRTNLTVEDRVDVLFSCLKEFLESKINHAHDLEEELSSVNQNLKIAVAQSSQSSHVQREKVELMEKQAALESELEDCKRNMIRYRDARDKAIASLHQRKAAKDIADNEMRLMNIRLETFVNGKHQSDKREAELRQMVERQRLDMQKVDQLKSGLAIRDKDCRELKAEVESLKTKSLEKDIEISKQKGYLLELKQKLQNQAKSPASVASTPANKIEPFSRLSSGLEHCTAQLIPQFAADFSRLQTSHDDLESRNDHLEKEVNRKDTEIKMLSLKLRCYKKKLSEMDEANRENSEAQSTETRSLQPQNAV